MALLWSLIAVLMSLREAVVEAEAKVEAREVITLSSWASIDALRAVARQEVALILVEEAVKP